MFAGEAQPGDQLWDPHDEGGEPEPGVSRLVYTVVGTSRQGAFVVLMARDELDGGRHGRVFDFDQPVPLSRPETELGPSRVVFGPPV